MRENEIINSQLNIELIKAIEQIKHGFVELVIQDSKVIQLNRTEKIRIEKHRKAHKEMHN